MEFVQKLHLGYNLANTLIPAQAFHQIFCSQGPLWVKCLSLKRGISQSNVHRIQWKVNQVIYIMYPYHDLNSSGSPVILLTRLLYHTKCQSWKREIIQSNIYRILPKFIQASYTLDTICMPNIMILALQIFCSQGPLWLKYPSMKRGIIQSNIHRILWKVINQVIYIIYLNCMTDGQTDRSKPISTLNFFWFLWSWGHKNLWIDTLLKLSCTPSAPRAQQGHWPNVSSG